MASFYRDSTIGRDTVDRGLIVDLSEHVNKLVNYEDISADLTDEQETKLVDFIKACSDMAHDRISRRYNNWKEADRAHDVYVPPDATRFREKAVISDTRAIADTVLTYQMAALAGRNPMFQLEGLNRDSRKSSAILERVLHQHMRRTAGEARVAQQLLDGIRYGYAPTKIIWNPKTNQNNIINVDPRKSFHDPRVQWGDWENMQFWINSSSVSYAALVKSGLYPKLQKFPALANSRGSKAGWAAHQHIKEEGRGLSIDPTEKNKGGDSFFTLQEARIVDEAWVCLAGYEIGVPQIDVIWMVVTVLDEDVIIRCQCNPYGQQFPVVLSSLYHDCHKTFGQSLYDLLLPMHHIATWLLRSRIDNVQSALHNLIFVDPTAVNIPDLVDRNPFGVVRTLPGTKPGEGVFIAQVPDVTASHWNDIGALSNYQQRLSAASDAQQGMPTADGIRTATEIARLTQLGSQRLGVLARIISATSVRPMVRMMVGNIQDALSFKGSIPIDSDNAPKLLKPMIQDGYLDFDESMFQGEIDYLVVDGTLPIEPTRNAETWMNMVAIANQTGLAAELDIRRMGEEAIRSMGVSDIDQFRIDRDAPPTPSQQMMMLEKTRGASVMPQEEMMREVEKGNLAPMAEVA